MATLKVSSFQDIDEAKQRFEADIDSAADALRLSILGNGLAMIHEAKYQEAKRYPAEPPHPFIEAEAEALGETPEQVAQSVLDARKQWETVAPQVEKGRIGAKRQVKEATTPAEMFAIHKAQIEEWQNPSNWFDNPVMEGDERTFDGKVWVSLVDYNVWEPPIGWREVVAEGYPAWVPPTGAHDAYSAGDRVTHNGSDWESSVNANTWEPGVYGWTQL